MKDDLKNIRDTVNDVNSFYCFPGWPDGMIPKSRWKTVFLQGLYRAYEGRHKRYKIDAEGYNRLFESLNGEIKEVSIQTVDIETGVLGERLAESKVRSEVIDVVLSGQVMEALTRSA